MQVVNILFSAVKSMQKILADDTSVCVDCRIQVQMNQWKIVWLPVWIKSDILLEVVLYLVRVQKAVLKLSANAVAENIAQKKFGGI